MKIAYIICRAIINLVFIAVTVGLSIYTNNYYFLWFLTIPILSHCSDLSFDDKKDSDKEVSNGK